MKSKLSLMTLSAATLFTLTLTGCATGKGAQRSGHPQHGQSPGAASSQGSPGRMGSMNMSNSDMMAMCRDMQAQMVSARTPQERQAMMAEHMKHMSPEMRQHCSMMQGQHGEHSSSR